MMLIGHFARLENNSWGVLVLGEGVKPKSGDLVSVTRRDGNKTMVTVGEIVAQRGQSVLCTLQGKDAPKSAPSQQQSLPMAPSAAEAATVEVDPQVAAKAAYLAKIPVPPVFLPQQSSMAVAQNLAAFVYRGQQGAAYTVSSLLVELTTFHEGRNSRRVKVRKGQLCPTFTRTRFCVIAPDQGAKPLALSRFAHRQLDGFYLPARLGPMLDRIAQDGAPELATSVYLHHVRTLTPSDSRQVLYLSAYDTALDDTARTHIRGVTSESYAFVPDLSLLRQVQDQCAGLSTLPVLRATVSDTETVIVFESLDSTLYMVEVLEPGSTVAYPKPVYTLVNSEVGAAALSLTAGIFRKRTADTGIQYNIWDEKKRFRWVHRGSSARIGDALQAEIARTRKVADLVFSAYMHLMSRPAETGLISDIFGDELSQEQLKRIHMKDALHFDLPRSFTLDDGFLKPATQADVLDHLCYLVVGDYESNSSDVADFCGRALRRFAVAQGWKENA